MKTNCVNCNLELDVKPNRLINNKRVSCSQKCAGLFRKTKTIKDLTCPTCNSKFYIKPFHRKKYKGPFTCSLECKAELQKISYKGSKNPNNRYSNDETFFSNIDNEEKAYILGFIASDGTINKAGFNITIHPKDKFILHEMRDIINKKIPIKTRKDGLVSLTVNSRSIADDLCKLLNISYGKKSHTVDFPNIREDLKIHFIRGFFDGDGYVSIIGEKHRSPRCGISTSSIKMRQQICNFINIPYWTDNKITISWTGNNALDFLNKLYENANIRMARKFQLYEDIATWVPSTSYSRYWKNIDFQWSKTKKNGVAPFKARASDSGYDLTLLEKVKTVGEVEYYDTGIKVCPNFGIYMMMVPRSSLTKSGYILANSIGIIDRTYVGTILVPLIKIDKTQKDLELPGRYVQIIPQSIIHVNFVQVNELSDTNRGQDGFGSSGI